MKLKIAAGIALLVALILATVAFFWRGRVLAEVGSIKITANDVRLSRKAWQHMELNVPTESGVLEKMLKGHGVAELLKARGAGTQLEEFLKAQVTFWNRTKESKKNFEDARAIVGNDMELVKRLILIPISADRLLFSEAYVKDDDFHEETRKKAEAFLEAALANPKKFTELAKKENFPLYPGKWVKGLGISLEQPMTDFSSGPRWEDVTSKNIENLEGLAPGKILDYLVEKPGGYWILKSVSAFSPQKNEIKMEAVFVARKPFRDWIEKNRGQIHFKKF